MKKVYKYSIVIVFVIIVLFSLNKLNGHLHSVLMNKFTNNFTYLPLETKSNVKFKKVYYCEYLDSFERMWYQYERLNFINDSTFQISTESTYFMDYFFPIKYYLGIINHKQWKDTLQRKYIIRNNEVFIVSNDSLIGTIKNFNNKIIFNYQRP